MTQELLKSDSKFNFAMHSLKEAMDYAKLIAESDLAPKDYKGKAGNVLIAMQFGSEIGLLPLQAIQNIAVINGRPAIWGDAMIALVQNHPLCESIDEKIVDSKAYCAVKRRGEEVYVVTFSMEDAKKAGLWGKPGPWSNYPNRMLQMRARSFALRDKFSDILKGLAMREEVEDYQPITVVDKTSASNKIKELLAEKSKAVTIEVLTDDRIKLMVDKFAKIGITENELEAHLGHGLSNMTSADMKTLGEFYKMMKEQTKDAKEQS